MKVELEIIKKILTEIHISKTDTQGNFKTIKKDFPSIEYPDICRHERSIIENNLATITNKESTNKQTSPNYIYNGLTSKGNDFLNRIQDESIYNKIKTIIDKVGINEGIKKAFEL